MPFSTSESVTTESSVEACLDAAREIFGAMSLVPTTEGQTVTAKSGSFLLAWMLGFMSSEKNMPVLLRVQAEDAGADRIVGISAEDAYPIPIKIGIAGKIRRQAEALAQSLKQALEQRLA